MNAWEISMLTGSWSNGETYVTPTKRSSLESPAFQLHSLCFRESGLLPLIVRYGKGDGGCSPRVCTWPWTGLLSLCAIPVIKNSWNTRNNRAQCVWGRTTCLIRSFFASYCMTILLRSSRYVVFQCLRRPAVYQMELSTPISSSGRTLPQVRKNVNTGMT